jgi:anthranilate synthase component 1
MFFTSPTQGIRQALQPYPPLAVIEKIIVKEKRGNCVPIFVEIPADLITPCMAYLKISENSKYSFLLESVIAGENIARYSFLGAGMYLSYLGKWVD